MHKRKRLYADCNNINKKHKCNYKRKRSVDDYDIEYYKKQKCNNCINYIITDISLMLLYGLI